MPSNIWDCLHVYPRGKKFACTAETRFRISLNLKNSSKTRWAILCCFQSKDGIRWIDARKISVGTELAIYIIPPSLKNSLFALITLINHRLFALSWWNLMDKNFPRIPSLTLREKSFCVMNMWNNMTEGKAVVEKQNSKKGFERMCMPAAWREYWSCQVQG